MVKRKKTKPTQPIWMPPYSKRARVIFVFIVICVIVILVVSIVDSFKTRPVYKFLGRLSSSLNNKNISVSTNKGCGRTQVKYGAGALVCSSTITSTTNHVNRESAQALYKNFTATIRENEFLGKPFTAKTELEADDGFDFGSESIYVTKDRRCSLSYSYEESEDDHETKTSVGVLRLNVGCTTTPWIRKKLNF